MTLRYTLAPKGPAIVLPDLVLATFDQFRQRSPRDKEAGGQLFARFDGADTVIVEATKPTWLDHRHHQSFEPNRWLQQREIRKQRTRGFHFVGDWHSHPEPVPRPSFLDIQSMKECFLHSQHELKNFVLIVVGYRPGSAGVYVALVNHKVIQLNLAE